MHKKNTSFRNDWENRFCDVKFAFISSHILIFGRFRTVFSLTLDIYNSLTIPTILSARAFFSISVYRLLWIFDFGNCGWGSNVSNELCRPVKCLELIAKRRADSRYFNVTQNKSFEKSHKNFENYEKNHQISWEIPFDLSHEHHFSRDKKRQNCLLAKTTESFLIKAKGKRQKANFAMCAMLPFSRFSFVSFPFFKVTNCLPLRWVKEKARSKFVRYTNNILIKHNGGSCLLKGLINCTIICGFLMRQITGGGRSDKSWQRKAAAWGAGWQAHYWLADVLILKRDFELVLTRFWGVPCLQEFLE